MAISQQQSRTIYQERKARLAIRLFLICFFIGNFFVKAQSQKDDRELFQRVFKERSKSQKVFIDPSNDNSYLISLLKQFQVAENSNNQKKMDSLKAGIGMDNELFIKIFNKSEYGNLISQHVTSKWDFNKLNIDRKQVFTKEKKYKGHKIFIAKPIYTFDKRYALVSTSSYIIVYEHLKTGWQELSIFNPMFR